MAGYYLLFWSPITTPLTAVDTAQAQRDGLHGARAANGAAATRALDQVDVGGLRGAGDELDASLAVVSLHGLGDHTPLVGPELAGYHIRNGGAGPLLPQLPDGIFGVVSGPQEIHPGFALNKRFFPCMEATILSKRRGSGFALSWFFMAKHHFENISSL